MSTFNVVYLREYVDPEMSVKHLTLMKLYTETYLLSTLKNLLIKI